MLEGTGRSSGNSTPPTDALLITPIITNHKWTDLLRKNDDRYATLLRAVGILALARGLAGGVSLDLIYARVVRL